MRNTDQNTSYPSATTTWSRVATCVRQALIALAILHARGVVAESEQACGNPPALFVTLPDEYESIYLRQPAVVCGFRHKITGFPTLTVVIEPAIKAQNELQIARYVTESYQRVGLRDARVKTSFTSPGVTSLNARLVVEFTVGGVAMEAQLAIILLHDRTYTATLQYPADTSPAAKTALTRVLDSVRLEGELLSAAHPGNSSYTLELILGLAGFSLVLFMLRRVSKKRQS